MLDNVTPRSLQTFLNANVVSRLDGVVQFHEGVSEGYHLVSVSDTAFRDDWLTIVVVIDPNRHADFVFHMHLCEGRHDVVCRVSKTGSIVDRGVSESVASEVISDGRIRITCTYYSVSDVVAFGTPPCKYVPGEDRHKFDIISLNVGLDRPMQVDAHRLLSYVDVGARGGRAYELKLERRNVQVTMFEPDPDAMTDLQLESEKYPGTKLIDKGLYSTNGSRSLYITAGAPCSSFLVPNFEFLASYQIGDLFKVERRTEVECARYDTLLQRGAVPRPDAIKIDVQGAEFEVLVGFGGLLEDCLGVQLESHLYQVYQGQRLLTDITAYLLLYDLVLVRLVPQKNFGEDLVEFDAWFLKTEHWLAKQGSICHEKMATLRRVWFL